MKSNINQKSPSEKLEDYYNQNSSNEESHALENLALEDEFTADAMEGLDAFPEALSSVPKFPNTKSYKSYWIGLGVVIVLGISFLMIKPNVKPEDKIVKNTIVELNSDTKNPTKKNIENIEVKENSFVQKKEKQERKTKVIYPQREKIILEKMELTPLENEEKELYDRARTKTKLIGFHNFLAVDYSLIYISSQEFETTIGGISADRENKNSKSKFGENNVKKIEFTYKQYLKESLGHLENKNYSLAIQHFETILNHYPEDVNAQFYLGYIFYHQELYEKSILMMKKVQLNSFDFFIEDAQWYEANSLENLGEKYKADKLFKEIKQKGGYYSNQVK